MIILVIFSTLQEFAAILIDGWRTVPSPRAISSAAVPQRRPFPDKDPGGYYVTDFSLSSKPPH